MHPSEDPQLRPVEGRKFPESLLRIIGAILFGLFVLLPLGILLVLAWWNGWSFGNRTISAYGAFIGALSLAAGLLTVVLVKKLFRRETYVIGKEYFQVATGNEKVTVQIPYLNISKIGLIRNQQGADFVRDFIGLNLVDVEDSTTLCPEAETSLNLHGWHYRIQKGLRHVPLEQLYELIVKQMPPDFQAKN